MPLFNDHQLMDVNARGVLCPEPACSRSLPAPRKCQSGVNHGKRYTACFNEAYGPRYKFWALGVVPMVFPLPPSLPLLTLSLLLPQCPPRERPVFIAPLAHASGMHSAHRASARRAVVPSPLFSADPRGPLATTSRQLPAAGLEEAAPRPRREIVTFPAPCLCDRELPHEHLARQQEAAARLAALTPLPPSPMLSQEARDETLAVSLALGISPPPSVTTADTRRVSLVSGCTVSRPAPPSSRMSLAGRRRGRRSTCPTLPHSLPHTSIPP
ncbi:hypothetical protein B0H14DRAFT_748825 [Mycena olivaceomarginata]|nr:hypothetical protein B0H14DRAFT_748825 [Mycena olivaceomarginata]